LLGELLKSTWIARHEVGKRSPEIDLSPLYISDTQDGLEVARNLQGAGEEVTGFHAGS
jgi:hypothetical protein